MLVDDSFDRNNYVKDNFENYVKMRRGKVKTKKYYVGRSDLMENFDKAKENFLSKEKNLSKYATRSSDAITKCRNRLVGTRRKNPI